MIRVAVLIVCIGCCLSAPVDDPVRIDLPVYDQPQSTSNIQLPQALEPENHPGGEPTNVQPGENFISNKIQATSNLLGNKFQTKASGINFGGPFSAPVTTRENALLESEGFGSKTLSVKENIQQVVAGLFQPKPIVDTITEEEKYGNNGDKFYGAGQALVGGAEGVSNIVNSVLEIPGSIIQKITRVATEKLNNLGGKLIGL